jgi:hypothetical protein
MLTIAVNTDDISTAMQTSDSDRLHSGGLLDTMAGVVLLSPSKPK